MVDACMSNSDVRIKLSDFESEPITAQNIIIANYYRADWPKMG